MGRIGLAASILASSIACNGDDPKTLGVREEQMVVATPCSPGVSCRDTVAVTFLGAGGFVIRRGAHALLAPPLFTRPSLPQVVQNGGSDEALVARELARVDTSGVEALIVGHSHYDHLMDVPAILRLMPSPRIFGSVTMKHVLAGDPRIDMQRIVAIDTLDAASATSEGQWYPVQGFRIKSVLSTHAPNFGSFTISDRTLDQDLPSLPPTPYDWPKGEVFAYIIDVLRDDGSVFFRMYYQDAASDPEHSMRPKLEPGDTKTFDLVILCGGNFEGATGYPASVLQAFTPRYAIVGHWDNFFRDIDEEPRLIPTLNGKELRRRMDEALPGRWAALQPFATAIFAVSPGG